MGYTTEFSGQVDITPPLNEQEIEFLNKFSGTRRMDRKNGPYFVDGSEDFGQGHNGDIREYNRPPAGQPGLWCQWVPNEDGTALEWDGGEKFYDATEWMTYLIEHFLKPDAVAKSVLPFLQGHTLNGEIDAEGEDSGDIWKLVVKKNKVSEKRSRVVYD